MNRIVTLEEFKDIPDRMDFRVFWYRRNGFEPIPVRDLLANCACLGTEQGAQWCVWIVNLLFKDSREAKQMTNATSAFGKETTKVLDHRREEYRKISHLSSSWRGKDPAPEAGELAADYLARIESRNETCDREYGKKADAVFEEAAAQITLIICEYIDRVRCLVTAYLKS